jgi:hypothetical protein
MMFLLPGNIEIASTSLLPKELVDGNFDVNED